MAKKKKKMLFEEVVEEVVEEGIEWTETIEITIEEPVVIQEECKNDWLATVMVMVNSIRFEGVIVSRWEHLKMCKDESKASAAAKLFIIL